MPRRNRARHTETSLAATSGFATALRTLLISAFLKVSIMFFAVAVLAKRFAIRHIKSQVRKRCPRLDMVGVKFTASAAAHALEPVARENGFCKSSPFRHQPGSLIIEGLAALPMRRIGADERFSGALTAAESRALVSGVENFSAVATWSGLRWIPLRPASPATEFGKRRPVDVHPVRTSANGTDQINPFAPRRYGRAFLCHSGILADSPAYCDVIVERWQTLTGGKATRG